MLSSQSVSQQEADEKAGAYAASHALRASSVTRCPGDAMITAKVQTRLQNYPALQPPNAVRVQTLDRVVYLYGLVDTDLERYLGGIGGDRRRRWGADRRFHRGEQFRQMGILVFDTKPLSAPVLMTRSSDFPQLPIG